MNWTVAGKAVSTEATYEFTVDKNVELTANFKETEKPVEKFTVTAKVNDSKMGTVKLDPDKAEYAKGEKVTATATAKEGYEFVNWTVEGKAVSTETTYEFLVDKNVELTANFKKTEKPVEKVTITVKANDSKMGTVKLDPAKESYENGEIVTAIATAKEGYKFVNWTVAGKVVSDKAEYKFKVDRAAELHRLKCCFPRWRLRSIMKTKKWWKSYRRYRTSGLLNSGTHRPNMIKTSKR